MARRRVSVKYARNLTGAERRVLHSMSFKQYGDLSKWLHYAVEWKTDDKVIIVKENDKVVGWGMRLAEGDKELYPTGAVGFWTRRTHRQKGIGGMMVRKAMTLGPIKVYPHDRASAALFSKFGVH